MTLIKINLTPKQLNAVEVGLDTIIDQLMQPYHKYNRQNLIIGSEAQEAVEDAIADHSND